MCSSEANIKINVKYMVFDDTYWIHLAPVPEAGSCEHSNEPRNSIKVGVFLQSVIIIDFQFLLDPLCRW
jgi:hypothetical protein